MDLSSRNPYLSLFAGGGGLDLAVKLAIPGSRCIGFVEIEAPAAGLLAQAIREKRLDDAPIWTDIRSFECERFRGRVAGIIGGFPCQDLSVAGKREGILAGNRSGLWFEYARLIREIEPQWVAIENVPAVLAFPAGGIVFGELARLGFDACWGTLRASSVGASHIRKRAFIFAWRRELGNAGYGDKERRPHTNVVNGSKGGARSWDTDEQLGYTGLPRRESGGFAGGLTETGEVQHAGFADTGSYLADAQCFGSERRRNHRIVETPAATESAQSQQWQRDGDTVDNSGEYLAHSERPKRWSHLERSRHSGEGSDGQGKAPGGAGEYDRHLEDSRCPELNGWTAQQTEKHRSWPSGNDSRASGTLDDSSLPLFAPGPGDPRWPQILAQYPELAPAESRFDRFVLALRRAGVLPDGLECTPERVGQYLRSSGLSKEAKSQIRELAHGSAADSAVSRTDQLRVLGNMVVPVCGAVGLTELIRRAGIQFVKEDE